MANELELEVITSSNSKGLRDAADAMDRTTHHSDEMGESFHESGKASHDLDGEIEKLRTHLSGLNKEYASTGDQGLFKDISRDRRALGNLEKIRSDLHATAEAEREAVEAGDRFDASGRKIRYGVHDLDVEISTLRDHVRHLGREYERTGDHSFLRDIARDKREIQSLTRLTRDLGDATDHSFLDFSNAFAGIGHNLRGMLIPTAIGLGALLAPAAGGIISGALLGTGVGAAMAGGILSAIKSDAVKNAGKNFLASVEADFFKGGDVFVGPIQRGLDILAKDVHGLDLAGTFAKTAPYVEMVAHGIGDLVKNFMPGFSKLLDKSGAASEIFSRGLGDTGSALSSFFTSIAASKGTLEGLEATFRIINGTIVTTGEGLRMLGNVFDSELQFNDELAHFVHDTLGQIPGGFGQVVNKTIEGTTRNLDQMSGSGEGVHNVIRAINPDAAKLGVALGYVSDQTIDASHATDRYRTALQGLDQTLEGTMGIYDDLHGTILNANQAMADLFKSLKQNGKTVDENSQAGRDNAQAFDSAFKAWRSWRLAQIAAGNDADKATREYDKQIKRLLELEKQAGATQQELDDLAKQYLIQITTKLVTVGGVATVGGGFDTADLAHQHAPHRARGGPVMAGETYMVGEYGPEPFTPSSSGYVWPTGSRPGGTTRIQMTLPSGAGGGLEEALYTWLRKNVQFTVVGSKVQVSVVR